MPAFDDAAWMTAEPTITTRAVETDSTPWNGPAILEPTSPVAPTVPELSASLTATTSTTPGPQLSMPAVSVSAATELSTFIAMHDALGEVIAQRRKAIAESLPAERDDITRVESPLGYLTITAPKPSIAVDQEALIAHLREVAPNMITETHTVVVTVDPAFQKELVDRLTIVDEAVFDTETAERVGWASAVPAKPATVSWAASAAQKRTKQRARLALADRLPLIAAPLNDEVTA